MKKLFLALAVMLVWTSVAFGEDNFDFRKSHWGDSIAQVKKSEKGKLLGQEKNALYYDIKTLNRKGSVIYTFQKGKLVSGTHSVNVKTYEELEEVLEILKSTLSKKYKLKDTTLVSEKDKDKKSYNLLKYIQEHSFVYFNEKTVVHLLALATEMPSHIGIIYNEKNYDKEQEKINRQKEKDNKKQREKELKEF